VSTLFRALSGTPLRSLAGRRAIVTGANTGLGFQTAQALADAGAEVVLAVRSASRGQAAADRIRAVVPSASIRVSELDLADLASVRAFVGQEGARGAVDVLVNNAGVMLVPERRLTADGFELHLGVNHLGHAALTIGLLPALASAPAGRVVAVGSIAHWFRGRVTGDLGLGDPRLAGRYVPMRAYAASKLAEMQFALELDRRLRSAGTGVTVVAAHPGWCATEAYDRDDKPGPMVRASRWATQVLGSAPAEGARALVAAAADPTAAAGDYLGPRWLVRGAPHRALLSPRARDRTAGKMLFDQSLALIGAAFDPSELRR
jgi:NAD(P)-dependent dehydrogenase (short-subunit alcohol dehydrogenase family)